MLFYEHDFIKTIANINAWTVSNDKKMPIHMQEFMTKYEIKGASPYDETSFTNLHKLYEFYITKLNSYPPNHAFYLDVAEDNVCILDIEPTCPDNIKKELLTLPYLYGEISMSGKGYHLAFKIPNDMFEKYPILYKKPVLKEEHGYYEILLNHFCTFTGKMISPSGNKNPNGFIDLIDKIVPTQKEISVIEIEVNKIDAVDTKMAEKILMLLHTASKQYKKSLNDYSNDHSKYEFAFVSFLYYKLKMILNVQAIKKENHEYTESEKAWFIWQAAIDYLPSRAKHNEYRDGLPWLLYIASRVIAVSDTSNKKETHNE